MGGFGVGTTLPVPPTDTRRYQPSGTDIAPLQSSFPPVDNTNTNLQPNITDKAVSDAPGPGGPSDTTLNVTLRLT